MGVDTLERYPYSGVGGRYRCIIDRQSDNTLSLVKSTSVSLVTTALQFYGSFLPSPDPDETARQEVSRIGERERQRATRIQGTGQGISSLDRVL
jgi:hypothetical protein